MTFILLINTIAVARFTIDILILSKYYLIYFKFKSLVISLVWWISSAIVILIIIMSSCNSHVVVVSHLVIR